MRYVDEVIAQLLDLVPARLVTPAALDRQLRDVATACRRLGLTKAAERLEPRQRSEIAGHIDDPYLALIPAIGRTTATDRLDLRSELYAADRVAVRMGCPDAADVLRRMTDAESVRAVG